jgi:uncharacterized protein (PEP-CTERM system associated)
VLLLAAAGGADAQDKLRITPSIEVTQGFDSNVGNTEHDEDSDVVTFFTPSVALSHEEGRGHTKLLLGLRSRSYWDHSELNAVDRYVRGDVERMLTQRLTFFSDGKYESRSRRRNPGSLSPLLNASPLKPADTAIVDSGLSA